jgi:hypothetical protein
MSGDNRFARYPPMRPYAKSDQSRDILSNPIAAGAVFWLPAAVLIGSGFLDIGRGWRTAVWVAALATMGIACLANAIRCGRVHCYATGPFFVITAVVALLYGLGIMPLGRHGWNVLSLAVIIGAIVLLCLPEAFLERYRQSHPRDRSH